MNTSPTLALAALICGTMFCNGQPSSNEYSEHSSSSNSVSSGNGYQVITSKTEINGNCVSKITISGPGIYKEVEYACNQKQMRVINSQNSLLVGEEYFVDTPSVLVHLVKDGCLKEVFQKNGDKYTSNITTMEESECNVVREKITKLIENQKKTDETFAQNQQSLQQNLQQMQQNLQNMQQNILGNRPFKGFPYGK